MTPELSLQALRIPQGWCVEYNSFLEIDLNIEEHCIHFCEDLLQIKNKALDMLIDVGIYGQNSDLSYRAEAYTGDFMGVLVGTFSSRNRLDIVNIIEQWMQNPPIPTS